MNSISTIKTLQLLGLLLIIFWLGGCATPKVYSSLQSLKYDYAAVRQDEAKRTAAPVTLYEVEGLIKKAEHAADNKDGSLVEHHTYLGKKKLEIALEKAQQKHYETLTKSLSEQRNALLIDARTKEAEAFQRQAQSSRLEAEIFKEQAEAALQAADEAKRAADAAKSSLEAYKMKETSRGTVLVLDDLLFDTAGYNLHPGSQKNLDPLIHYLKENEKRNVSIEGHTDSVGEVSYNQTLSQHRAEAVRNYLVQSGIAQERIVSKGLGEHYPVATNNTREGRQMNRRVEILIKN